MHRDLLFDLVIFMLDKQKKLYYNINIRNRERTTKRLFTVLSVKGGVNYEKRCISTRRRRKANRKCYF